MGNKVIYLHVGYPKTGTSSLQFFLFKNRLRLKENDYLYPESGLLFIPPYYIAHYLIPFNLFYKKTGIKFYNLDFPDDELLIKKLRAEIENKKCNNIIISCESFLGLLDIYMFVRFGELGILNIWKNFLSSFKDFKIKIVLYLRELFDYSFSFFYEQVEHRIPYDFYKFLELYLSNKGYNLSFRCTIEFFQKLEELKMIDEIIIREYRKDINIIEDFLKILKIKNINNNSQIFLNIQKDYELLIKYSHMNSGFKLWDDYIKSFMINEFTFLKDLFINYQYEKKNNLKNKIKLMDWFKVHVIEEEEWLKKKIGFYFSEPFEYRWERFLKNLEEYDNALERSCSDIKELMNTFMQTGSLSYLRNIFEKIPKSNPSKVQIFMPIKKNSTESDTLKEEFIKVFEEAAKHINLSEEEQREKLYEAFVKSEFELIESFLSELKSREFLIYGAGEAGRFFYKKFCEEFGILPLAVLDKYSSIRFSEKIPLLKFPEETKSLSRDLKVVITVLRKDLIDEILIDLKKEGFKKVYCLDLNLFNFIQRVSRKSWEFRNFFAPHHFMSKFSRPITQILPHKDKLLEVYSLLVDQKSKRVLYEFLKKYLTFEKALNPDFDPLDMQYFPEDIPLRGDYSVFVDGGAYVGDTIKALNNKVGKIKRLYCFEPDEANFDELMRFVKSRANWIAEEIYLYNYALYSKRTILNFWGGLGYGSYVNESEVKNSRNELVFSISLDDLIDEIKPTFIKLDIEGSELEALKGAKETIRRYKPDLSVCLYHKPEHFWEVPLFLRELVPNYKFYIRKYGPNIVLDYILYATANEL